MVKKNNPCKYLVQKDEGCKNKYKIINKHIKAPVEYSIFKFDLLCIFISLKKKERLESKEKILRKKINMGKIIGMEIWLDTQ